MAANTASLQTVREFVRIGATQARLPEARTVQLELVVEEIFLNVCRYAYADGSEGIAMLTCSIPELGEMSVEVADQGVAFNPLETPPPDVTLALEDRPTGGLGIFLVKSLASSVSYHRGDGWNRVTIFISANA